MNAMTVRDFRTNLSANFDRVDAGERILVRRRNRVYTIVAVEDGDLMISPKLQARIEEAERECREGRCVSCRTTAELDSFLDSL